MVNVIRKLVLLCLIVSLVIPVFSFPVSADTKPSQTAVSEYAMSWHGNKNVPYVWGGGRDGDKSLEDLAAIPAEAGHPKGSCKTYDRCSKCKATGTDCSGFTSKVYKHFGIDIPDQSGKQKDAAIKIFKDINQAVPGDIVWWTGHVAIYVGNEKIVHTNTSDPSSANYPHVESVWYSSKGKPTFCRMVEDVSALKPISGSDANSLNNLINGTKRSGSIVDESDLTGMPDKVDYGADVDLPDKESLTTGEIVALESIQEDIETRKTFKFSIIYTIISFAGFFVVTYGIFLVVAYLFDRANNILDFSLLELITLGKYTLWEEGMANEVGYDKHRDKVYCDSRFIIKRFLVIELVGFLLVSGFVLDLFILAYKTILAWLGI